MPDIAIKVENLSKLYQIGARQEGYKTLRQSIMVTLATPFHRLVQRAKRKVSNSLPTACPVEFPTSRDYSTGAPCPMPSSSDDGIWALKNIFLEI